MDCALKLLMTAMAIDRLRKNRLMMVMVDDSSSPDFSVLQYTMPVEKIRCRLLPHTTAEYTNVEQMGLFFLA